MLASNFLRGLKSKIRNTVTNVECENDLDPLINAKIKVDRRYTMISKDLKKNRT